ncbi:MAG: VOC family protein [Planctomycetota bacterium]
MTQLTPFHLAFPVDDLESTREFYCKLIGCSLGRTSEHWIDFNMFGHQVVAHCSSTKPQQEPFPSGVDGKDVPIPHFGVVLEWDIWHQLSQRLRSANVNFIIEPYIRFEGEVGEQATMFLQDPSGNSLEFKSFKDFNQIFAS